MPRRRVSIAAGEGKLGVVWIDSGSMDFESALRSIKAGDQFDASGSIGVGSKWSLGRFTVCAESEAYTLDGKEGYFMEASLVTAESFATKAMLSGTRRP